MLIFNIKPRKNPPLASENAKQNNANLILQIS